MQAAETNQDAIRRAVKPVAAFLESRGIGYAVVGSVAGLSHGYGRTTIDVDVLVEFPKHLVQEFVAEFEADYYVDAGMIEDAIRHRSSFNLYHFDTGIKVDCFVSKESDFDKSVTSRRERETMSDESTPAFFVQSAEDLILSKMVWFRKGGESSDRQWNDILAVLKVQQLSINMEYLEHWAERLRVADLLDKALVQTGISAE